MKKTKNKYQNPTTKSFDLNVDRKFTGDIQTKHNKIIPYEVKNKTMNPNQKDINKTLMTSTEQTPELRRIFNAMQDVINAIKLHLSSTKDGLEKIYQVGYCDTDNVENTNTPKSLTEEFDKLYQELIEISTLSMDIKNHVHKII